jgi:hypothetical protein
VEFYRTWESYIAVVYNIAAALFDIVVRYSGFVGGSEDVEYNIVAWYSQ